MSGAGVQDRVVQRRLLDAAAAREAAEGMARGTFATVCAATRTRRRWTLFAADGGDFRLLRQLRGHWQLSTGPAARLPGELVELPGELETRTGATVDDAPFDPRPTRLAPGDALALAEVVRHGDAQRIQAACDDLALAGLPWWLAQLAWGAEALLSMMLTVHDRPQFVSLLQLLPSGWGCLHADADDDLGFRPMSRLEVQARLAAFAARLLERAHE